MMKLVRFIGFLALVLFLGQQSAEASIAGMTDDVSVVSADSSFDAPQLSDPLEAELAGNGVSYSLFHVSRVQGAAQKHITSLREWGVKLAFCDSRLLQNLARLFPTVTAYHPLPVCNHYIFALRRILI